MIMSGSVLPSLLVGFSTTNFTRAWEPTLSWNQLHSQPGSVGVLSEIAFHEKAGRSQVDFFAGWNIVSLPPSGHCRHASIRTLKERFISLGACWAFSVQPVLPSVCRPVVLLFRAENLGQAINAVTGTRLWLLSFLFLERF